MKNVVLNINGFTFFNEIHFFANISTVNSTFNSKYKVGNISEGSEILTHKSILELIT